MASPKNTSNPFGTWYANSLSFWMSRSAIVLCIGLALLVMGGTTAYSAENVAPEIQATSTLPNPIPVRCPAGTIDINGNGRDDGGDDCQNLDIVAAPSSCAPSPNGGLLPSREGQVECFLPLSAGGTPLSVGDSVGCLDILRAPYPRTMVNLQEPTSFNIVGLIPPDRLGYPDGAPGSYRLGPLPWTTMGQFLHERWGWWAIDSRGQAAFSTEAVRPAGDAYWYPSIDNIRAYLMLSLSTNATDVVWWVDRYPSQTYHGGFPGNPIEIKFFQSSFPLTGQEGAYSPYGPSRTGTNTLPAFKVRTRTVWQAYFVVEWDSYGVNSNNEYVLTGHTGGTVPVGAPLTSYRVWDGRQSPDNTGQTFCNAADGYLPVPVLEAQAVIRQ